MDSKTKIICTIGPASERRNTLREMLRAGMDAIRINASHGTMDEYRQIISNVRSLSDIPIILDIIGPEIRIKSKEELMLRKGLEFEVGFDKSHDRYITFDFYDHVKRGDHILLADGLLYTRVVGKKNHTLTLKSTSEGLLKVNKSASVPGRRFDVKLFSKYDLKLIEFAKRLKLDFISMSFVRGSDDVLKLRKILGNSGIGIISKIENVDGVRNIDSIIGVSDGIMVARGDLGVDLPPQKLPMVQKDIIRRCNIVGMPVTVATEMLASMVEKPRPSRAEASDVANAVLDGADSVMLSDETTVGAYPVEAVSMMSRILLEVEPHVRTTLPMEETRSVSESIARAVSNTCSHLKIDVIVTFTRSGHTSKLVSRYRPRQDIIAVTSDPKLKRMLDLVYGVRPVVYEDMRLRDRTYNCARFLHKTGRINKSDRVLFTAGAYSMKQHRTNLLEIHRIDDLFDYYRRNSLIR
ncbi:MAG: pyruvate kinase [Candidatus Altiarchaeota archaeon]